LVARALHEQARARQAQLALVEEGRTYADRYGPVQIDVGEDDIRALAAELERESFQVPRGNVHDRLSSRRLAGEGYQAHVGVLSQERARRLGAKAVDNVEHAGRQASL